MNCLPTPNAAATTTDLARRQVVRRVADDDRRLLSSHQRPKGSKDPCYPRKRADAFPAG